MATLTVPSEFRRVQAHFPILFRRETGRDDFTALAMFGFQTGENLFLDGARWDAGYRPLSLAIGPFLIGRPAGGEGPGQEIGSASCRERVCQYVSFSAVAVSLKKNQPLNECQQYTATSN